MPSERIEVDIDRLLDDASAALGPKEWDVSCSRCLAVPALDPESAGARAYLDTSARASGSITDVKNDAAPAHEIQRDCQKASAPVPRLGAARVRSPRPLRVGAPRRELQLEGMPTEEKQ